MLWVQYSIRGKVGKVLGLFMMRGPSLGSLLKDMDEDLVLKKTAKWLGAMICGKWGTVELTTDQRAPGAYEGMEHR